MAALLAGCASMAPPHQRPPLPVPDAWGQAAPEEGVAAAAVGWNDYFVDPQLRALIGQALQSNRDLRLAALRIEEARAAYRIQRAGLYPTVGVSADGSRARVPGDLNLSGRTAIASQYQVGLGASAWELDFWGRVASLRDAALETFLASEAAHRAVALGLITQVAQTYLAIRELDERIALAGQTLGSRSESLRIFRRRVEVGATSRLDLIQVEVLWEQARTLVAQLEQERAAQGHALELLLGAQPQLAPAATRPGDTDVLKELSPGLPSDLLENRPDIIAAEHQLKAASANIGAARAAFFPRVALTGALGTASASLGGLFESGSLAWSFAPSLSLPIFDGGARRASLDLAEVRREQSVAQYEKTIQSAFRDVLDALAARRWLAEQVSVLTHMQAAQTERARLAKLRYDNGAAAFLEVLDAQREQLTVEQQLVQARRALLAAGVSLYAALGGGTKAPEGGAPAVSSHP
ncbi:efflux transporter outer membrane subunit [Pigmentiphaga humi]|nr:efflux transporter outer membrane subunit [Pigmentiphaga humi]